MGALVVSLVHVMGYTLVDRYHPYLRALRDSRYK
jgi:hypothetical protein